MENIKKDDLIAIALTEPVSGDFSYVGWLEEANHLGITVDQIDWFTGNASGRYYFIPWTNVFGYFRCEAGNEEYFFDDRAQRFQREHKTYLMNKLGMGAEK